MRTVLVAAAVALLALLFADASKAKAGDCGYNRGVVVQTQVVYPVATQVVVPQVVSQVAVVPVVQKQVIVQQAHGFYGGGFVQSRGFSRGGFQSARFGGGFRGQAGGGGFIGDAIRAVGDVANSPAGLVTVGALLRR